MSYSSSRKYYREMLDLSEKLFNFVAKVNNTLF